MQTKKQSNKEAELHMCVCSCCCVSRKKAGGNVCQQKEKPKTMKTETGRMSSLPGRRAEAGKKATLGSQSVSHSVSPSVIKGAAVHQGSLLSTQLTLRAKGVATRSNRSDETRTESWEMRAIINAQCQVIKNHLGEGRAGQGNAPASLGGNNCVPNFVGQLCKNLFN